MKKINEFLKSNYLIFLYLGIVSLFEIVGVFITVGKFSIRDVRLFLIIQCLISFVALAIKNNSIRHAFLAVLIFIAGMMNLFFIVVYEMTGTFFDFGMLNLRGDAMAIIESIPINFAFFCIFSVSFAIYFILGRRYMNSVPESKKINMPISVKSFAMFSLVLLCFFTMYSINGVGGKVNYKDKLYGSKENGYGELGITSNFFNELYNGFLNSRIELGDIDEMNKFIYDPSSIYYASDLANPLKEDRSNFNLVTILGETFEWFSFVQDLVRYPNGYNLENSDVLLRQMYPNLYRFYDMSIVNNNFHAREKTDISENLSIIGSYPTEAYINYDYPYNTVATSIPNVLKTLDQDILSNSYHNGLENYYNRNVSHMALGFEKYVASETMEEELGMPNYYDKGEKNLDSLMMEYCKELMFPTDRRFNTYITSITMHGQFSYRECLAEYYDKLAEFGFIFGSNPDDKMYDPFLYYIAAAMDFDRAIGIMLDYLEQNNLLDKTIIVIFGDHNAYYQGLTNHVKEIYDYNAIDYTNLYRVPLMIYCPNMPHKVYDKFMCTADIVPTILDLMGINFYSNLYFGNSLFSEEVSILYSRAYNVFLDDKIYFNNINNIYFCKDENNISYAEERALKLLNKLEYCDRIFHNDFFGITENGEKIYFETFKNNLKLINR